jgi:hypothetical protein
MPTECHFRMTEGSCSVSITIVSLLCSLFKANTTPPPPPPGLTTVHRTQCPPLPPRLFNPNAHSAFLHQTSSFLGSQLCQMLPEILTSWILGNNYSHWTGEAASSLLVSVSLLDIRWFGTLTMRPRTKRPQDDASPGRCVPRTIHPQCFSQNGRNVTEFSIKLHSHRKRVRVGAA